MTIARSDKPKLPPDAEPLVPSTRSKLASSIAPVALVSAAESGDAPAQFALAVALREGRLLPQDLGGSLHWYRAAAEQGHAKAQNDLGSMYLNGMGTGRNPEEAVRWYRAAADQGQVDAMFNLGIRYRSGTGVAQDHAEACAWFARAADAGSREAMSELGTAYRFGNGVTQSFETAARWHVEAAALDDVVAMGNLADYREELERLALGGSLTAAHHLGRMYEGGLGVEQDAAMVYAWVRWGWRECRGALEDDARAALGYWLSDLRFCLPAADRQRGLEAFNRCRVVRSIAAIGKPSHDHQEDTRRLP